MNHYDRRIVTAPDWMKNFQCIADQCPETCCQQWNIDVDPVHAECYTHLGDPELQEIMNRLLHRFHLRRPGMRKPELQYRFMLLNQQHKRCPLLDEGGKCRLQKKYGADILCDTCYFHPRTFWQIDEETGLSACLSCPECARLALFHEEPTAFSRFETEIDPNADWLETSLITDIDTRLLMQNRELLVRSMCELLQNRSVPIDKRISKVNGFFHELMRAEHPDTDEIHRAFCSCEERPSGILSDADPVKQMRLYLDTFQPISENLEKPAQGTTEFFRSLAGGTKEFAKILAENYEKGCQIMAPFLKTNEYLLENFLVHCVFSDSFKQFYRCQNEHLSVRDILIHEAALLEIWYLFLHILLAQTALALQAMDGELFLQTIIHADKTWWHYPDWFARCADRYSKASAFG